MPMRQPPKADEMPSQCRHWNKKAGLTSFGTRASVSQQSPFIGTMRLASGTKASPRVSHAGHVPATTPVE